ncbi:MAG: UDP-N-acetylmuramate--L-alanine ligase [Oscillospiraceae bacterium]|nr:UDP-N-acetylmuramate--L-alanine ligase [Oscillospiraceae bacterium]
MDRFTELENLILSGKRAHLVGIGGVSMSPLASVLAKRIPITGSDIHESSVIRELRGMGVTVYIGHRAENVLGADFVIRTAAARDDNPEIACAREKGIPVFERAEAWGVIMRHYKNALCISGTHGKTTTTSMCTHIMMAAGADPTVMIGGTLPLIHAGHRVGAGDTIILESCEYYDSFLSFFPTIAVVLDVDNDHLDYFKNLEAIKTSFRRFAERVPRDTGIVIYNGDDENTVSALKGIDRKTLSFGLEDANYVHAANIVMEGAGYGFDIIRGSEKFCRISLRVPGLHNVKNALAAAASCMVLGVDGDTVSRGLSSFGGAERRFQYKGTCRGADVYDDYAHHPSELHALIDAVLALGRKRVIVAFQPHTYSRTKLLFGDFVSELRRCDKVYLAEIYAAREQNTVGISSADLAAQIPGAVFCPTFTQLEKALREEARPGDIILTVGAGDIYTVGEAIAENI